ncbi:hypothetical protein [Isoptericola sediminis]|uniref:Uncharacterized protein n=1 Tax=Isoptericola sediminis TaxID=2733572 RepID=A0A849K329_9MICO|nr:hypothetical protein [Isoptericola sediminis]NNU27658.1 hypothetical protein [Isoptericola sediminis]
MFVTTSDVATAAALLRRARHRLEDATAALHRARGPGWESAAGDSCRDAVAEVLTLLDADGATLQQADGVTARCLDG